MINTGNKHLLNLCFWVCCVWADSNPCDLVIICTCEWNNIGFRVCVCAHACVCVCVCTAGFLSWTRPAFQLCSPIKIKLLATHPKKCNREENLLQWETHRHTHELCLFCLHCLCTSHVRLLYCLFSSTSSALTDIYLIRWDKWRGGKGRKWHIKKSQMMWWQRYFTWLSY